MLKFNELTLPDMDFENGHILETNIRICNWQSKKEDEKVSMIISCDSQNKKASITLQNLMVIAHSADFALKHNMVGGAEGSMTLKALHTSFKINLDY